MIEINMKTPQPEEEPLKEENPNFIKKIAHTSTFVNRIHILKWIGNYDRSKAIADMIAGLTIGLTIIPQSIAYAALAGLSPEYGLYSAFVGAFVYVAFGTIPQVSIGPTSLMALLTLQYTYGLPVEFAIILAFLAGVVELAMGIFNLGFIVNLISNTVTSAFTTGTSIIVSCVQMKTLMGIKSLNNINMSNFLDKINISDSILGFVSIAILMCLRQLARIEFGRKNVFTNFCKKMLWYVSISRNAIIVLGTSLFAYHMLTYNVSFTLSTKVNSTSLLVQPPPFIIKHNNTTYNFIEICMKLRGAILVVPLVAVLANVAIAKAFVKDSVLDASQEMLTLGICNIAGSFFRAMPTCGAFTRSAVSQASGVKTPLSGIYSGALVLLALNVLTPYFEFIPRSSLSAVLISAVIFMADFRIIKELWLHSKKDVFNWIGVFLVCLAGGVELGLLFGIFIDAGFIIILLANPKIEAYKKQVNGMTFIHIEPCTDIYYAGGDSLRTKINSVCSETEYKVPVVIDCSKLTQYDFTLVQILRNILKDLTEKKVKVFLLSLQHAKKEHFSDIKNVCLIDKFIEQDI